jgi:hypothetical protein
VKKVFVVVAALLAQVASSSDDRPRLGGTEHPDQPPQLNNVLRNWDDGKKYYPKIPMDNYDRTEKYNHKKPNNMQHLKQPHHKGEHVSEVELGKKCHPPTSHPGRKRHW